MTGQLRSRSSGGHDRHAPAEQLRRPKYPTWQPAPQRRPGYNFRQIDLRLVKVFRFDRTRLELLLEAFNLENHVNRFLPVGNLRSPFFGRAIEADAARQVQLAVRLQFRRDSEPIGVPPSTRFPMMGRAG